MPDHIITAPPAALILSAAFAFAVIAMLLVQFWLASRQLRHVARHRDAVPPAFAGHVSAAAHRRAADYTIAKTRFGLLEAALSAAVLIGWTLLGGLDWLNHALLGVISPGLWQQLALLACFALIGGLIELPLSLYKTFGIERRFGFNRMSGRLWLADLLKSTLFGTIIALPIAALVLWLMGAAGRFWWLWAAAAWMAFNLLLLVIYPLFIAPMFNRFEPLADVALKARVTQLMQRCGFRADGLFVMDGSKRSAHGNAYFTGFGAARRVVFYDTLLARLAPAEVGAVLAHELGHFKHKHVTKRIVLMFAASFAGFALLGWLSTKPWFYAGLGVMPNLAAGAPNDALALLLFMLAVPVPAFFVSPLAAQLSRRQEFEADAYAVQQTSGGELSAALLKLYEDNASTLTPDPLYVRFYYSHPSAAERLARLAPAALQHA